jgi:predicted acylesterase/phospholipase RssA
MIPRTMLHFTPPEPFTSRSSARPELRLALAMRGGVSLAVWIGGACAEIEALRASANGSPERPVHLYAELLAAAGYDGVTIDVLSGASAGGLNAVLISTSLAYGVPFDRMKRLWLELADIEALLRDPGDPKPISVLRGDEYFLTQLQDKLQVMIEEATRDRRDVRHFQSLDLHLAVTLLDPVKVMVNENWARRFVEESQRASFRFRHNPYTSDFLDNNSRPRPGIAYKLALAARSSSSFPGAFEPAQVRVRRPRLIGERGGTTREDMFGILSQGSPEQMLVMDGGVLDNIPVGRAIRSVATSSAQGPTERWMLFLHPSPEESAAGVVQGSDQRPRALQTALRAFSTSASSESLLDDVEVLRQHNDSASRYRLLYDALIGRLVVEQSTALAITEATSGYGAYLRLRAAFAAARIRFLIENPVSALGEDPFTDNRYLRPLGPLDEGQDAWPQELRVLLERELAAVLWEPPPWPMDGPLTQDIEQLHLLGVPPLIRVIDTLIGVVRQLEGRVTGSGQLTWLGDEKGHLYALRDVADLLGHMSDLFWPVYTCHEPPDPLNPRPWATDAELAREAFLRYYWRSGDPRTDPAELGRLSAELLGLFEHLRRELLRRWDELERLPWAHDAAAPGGGAPMDLVRELWVRLVECLLAVAAEAERVPRQDLDEDAGLRLFLDALGWIRQGDSYARAVAEQAADVVVGDARAAAEVEQVLEEEGAVEPPMRPGERAVRLLAAFEVLSFPLAMTALLGSQPINFLRVAGTNVTPLQRWFPGGRLRVGDKLAGNELKNFAAFYKPSWRANDWMWGRLDAATSLLDLLVRPSAIASHFELGLPQDQRAASFRELVERLVCADPITPHLDDKELEQWRMHFQELWGEHRDAVAAEATQLFGDQDEVTLLTRTKEVLTARRHWELLLSELPDVVGEAAGSDLREGISPRWRPSGWSSGQRRRLKEESLMQAAFAVKARGLDPLRQPDGMKALLGSYRVGRETVLQEAGSDRFTRTGANLLVVAWNALTGGHKLGFLRPIGWGLRLLRLLALAVVQAPRWAVVLLLSTIALAAYIAVEDRTWFGINRQLATVAILVAAALLFYWSTLVWRGVIAIAIVAAVAFLAFNLSGQISLQFRGSTLLDGHVDEVAFILVLVVAPLLWAATGTLRWWISRHQRSSRSATPR